MITKITAWFNHKQTKKLLKFIETLNENETIVITIILERVKQCHMN